MNFLVVKPSSLGDIIHTMPAVELLRRCQPEGTITWVVNDVFSGIVELCPAVDEIILFRRRRLGKLRHLPELIRFFNELRRQPYDVAIDFQGLFRSGLMTLASGARRRVGFHNAREGAGLFYNEKVMLPANLKHAVDRNLFLARSVLGGSPEPEVTLTLPSQHDLAKSARKLLKTHPVAAGGPIVAIGPSARWESKAWPLRFFAEVMEALSAAVPGIRFWTVGTAEESERCARLLDLCPHCNILNLAGRTDLGTLTELLRVSDVLLTNDSGPMHLAAAVGTPTVALFGATDPDLTGPYGKEHQIFRTTCELTPCFSRHCLCTNRVCSDGTAPAEVAAAVMSRFRREGSQALPQAAQIDSLLQET